MVLAAKVEELAAPMKASVRTEISLQNVSVSYSAEKNQRKTVLSGMNLEIEAGEFIVLLGETGCGKSTLLRLILGQEFPTEGKLCVDGKPVTRIDARCGYVPQKYSLFPDRSALDNVMYGPLNAHSKFAGWFRPSRYRRRKQIRIEAEEYLTRMGLRPGDMKKYPHQLSGGMQQRVAIAQCLMMRPPVLLMDEAFSALDPSTRASLQQLVKQVWHDWKPTVVFVTHNTSEALLLGTRLILLTRHTDQETSHSNVALDMKLPCSGELLSIRKQSKEFRELVEYVERFTCPGPELVAESPYRQDFV